MNCDQAFEHLTDRALRTGPELQAHLADCARCRNLLDVFGPAIELFDGPPPVESSRSSESVATLRAGTEGTRAPVLSPEAVRIAENLAADLSARAKHSLPVPARTSRVVTRYAAAFVVGACAAWAFVVLPSAEDNPNSLLPAGKCTREQVASTEGQSPERVKLVVQTCVTCHLESESGRIDEARFDLQINPGGSRSGPLDSEDLDVLRDAGWNYCALQRERGEPRLYSA